MSLLGVRPFLNKSANTGLRMMCVRWSHHDKPANPINPPPNDHLNFKVQTLDDLPKPDLDYYAYYAQQQKKYWLHLIFGSACLGATLYYMYAYEPVYFNAFPPELPPKEERIKSFWVEPEDEEEDDDE